MRGAPALLTFLSRQMTSFTFRTAKMTRRTVVLTALAVLAAAAGAGYVVAASVKADFDVSVSPATQTVSQGQVAKLRVNLSKTNGFSSTVALSVSGLPAATKAGFSPNPVVVGKSPGDTSTLTIQTNVGGTTPAGTSTVTVTGVSGGLEHAAAARLTVVAAAAPNFSLAATPATQTIARGEDTNYALDIARSGGFTGSVALSAGGLPAGATAAFAPATVPASPDAGTSTVVLTTSASTPPGSHAVTLTGTGQAGGATVSRTTAVTLVVQESAGFAIAGDLPANLPLGRTLALDLRLTNPSNFDLRVTGITATIQDATTSAGCSGVENLRVRQIPASRYPITIPGGASMLLSQLGVAAADRPQVELLNLNKPQNACLGATFRLSYAGTAVK